MNRGPRVLKDAGLTKGGAVARELNIHGIVLKLEARGQRRGGLVRNAGLLTLGADLSLGLGQGLVILLLSGLGCLGGVNLRDGLQQEFFHHLGVALTGLGVNDGSTGGTDLRVAKLLHNVMAVTHVEACALFRNSLGRDAAVVSEARDGASGTRTVHTSAVRLDAALGNVYRVGHRGFIFIYLLCCDEWWLKEQGRKRSWNFETGQNRPR